MEIHSYIRKLYLQQSVLEEDINFFEDVKLAAILAGLDLVVIEPHDPRYENEQILLITPDLKAAGELGIKTIKDKRFPNKYLSTLVLSTILKLKEEPYKIFCDALAPIRPDLYGRLPHEHILQLEFKDILRRRILSEYHLDIKHTGYAPERLGEQYRCLGVAEDLCEKIEVTSLRWREKFPVGKTVLYPKQAEEKMTELKIVDRWGAFY